MSSHFFGTVLSVLWVLYVTVGFWSQIQKNRQTSRFGWSAPLFLLAYTTYIFGTLYGFVSRNVYIAIPYTVGLIFLNVLLLQYLRYRKN